MRVKVRVTPDARREKVERTGDAAFTIAVKEPAERNMANERVRTLLAYAFSVPLRSVRLVTGHRSSVKMYTVALEEQ